MYWIIQRVPFIQKVNLQNVKTKVPYHDTIINAGMNSHAPQMTAALVAGGLALLAFIGCIRLWDKWKNDGATKGF